MTTFTPAGFRAVLEAALGSGYAFCSFDDRDAAAGSRVCLLRHDVDADLGAALDVARIEHELGVRATYFLMLRSPLYNLLGRGNRAIVNQIVELGHWLGLHYDLALAPDDAAASEGWIRFEADVLAREFGVPIGAVSFHQPAGSPIVRDLRPAGLVSAFDLPGFRYVSDVNKSVEAATLTELFRTGEHPRLQVLIHPLWWVGDDGASTTEMLWDRALLANLERAQLQLLETERAYGARRSFRIERSQQP